MRTITPELARILGHIYGDGCIDKTGNLYYINKDKTLINNFIKDIKVTFGNVKIKTYSRKDGVRRVYVQKSVCKLLKNTFIELKTKIAIPELLKDSTYMVKSSFLQAIFDDEGSVLWNKKRSCRIIHIAMRNKRLVSQILELLEQLSIKTNGIKRTSTTYGSLWGFTITSQENLEKYFKLVNFSHPKKYKKLFNMVKCYKQPHSKKSRTISKILTKLQNESLTIPEIKKFIGKSETHTRRIITELKELRKIDKAFLQSVYDKRGVPYHVYKWKTI